MRQYDFRRLYAGGGHPLYRQIIRHVQRGLAAGTIAFGDELPSRRTLSALLG